MLDQLKNLNVERPNLEELVSLHAFSASLKAGYEKFGVEEPEWLSNSDREIGREIRNRVAADIDRRIRETQARIVGLETTTEKRQRLEQELASLKSKVAGGATV